MRAERTACSATTTPGASASGSATTATGWAGSAETTGAPAPRAATRSASPPARLAASTGPTRWRPRCATAWASRRSADPRRDLRPGLRQVGARDREELEPGRAHPRAQPPDDGPVRVAGRELVQAGLVLPDRERPERLPGQARVQRVADQPGGLPELAADPRGVAQEAGNEAVGLQRQPRRHRDVLALRVDRLALQPGQGGHRDPPSVIESIHWKDNLSTGKIATMISDMAPGSRPYHHGNLGPALVSAAIGEIEASGPAAMSLRAVARRAGVTHAAATYHFGDRAGLLTAVAAEGYRLLTDALREALQTSGSFLEVGVAYVRFAVTHRAHFEVMYRPELYHPDDPEIRRARAGAAVLLYGTASPDAGQLAAGAAAWSLVHGLATLWLNGNLPEQLGHDPEEITRIVAPHLDIGRP